jgi:hypothetical protein
MTVLAGGVRVSFQARAAPLAALCVASTLEAAHPHLYAACTMRLLWVKQSGLAGPAGLQGSSPAVLGQHIYCHPSCATSCGTCGLLSHGLWRCLRPPQGWESPNGTNEHRGQFPELYIRCTAEVGAAQ